MVPKLIDIPELLEGIKKQRWQNAKTYKNIAPHSYFLKYWNPSLFDLFEKTIGEHGADEQFFLFGHTKMYRYIYLLEYRYWIDDNVLNRTEIKNIIHRDGISMQKIEETNGTIYPPNS